MVLQFFIHIQHSGNGSIKSGKEFVLYNQQIHVSVWVCEASCHRIFIGIIIIFEKWIDLFAKELCNGLQRLRRISFIIAFFCRIGCNNYRRRDSSKTPEFVEQLDRLCAR